MPLSINSTLRVYVKFLLMYEVYLWFQVFLRKFPFWSSMSLSFFKIYCVDHFSLFAVGKLKVQFSIALTGNQYKLKFDYLSYIPKTHRFAENPFMTLTTDSHHFSQNTLTTMEWHLFH